MKALILSEEKEKRVGYITNYHAKLLIPIDNMPIIEWQTSLYIAKNSCQPSDTFEDWI
jgi:NDP-sugar pyrophosphorylase family protein